MRLFGTIKFDNEDITELVTDSSFLEDFKTWYLNK